MIKRLILTMTMGLSTLANAYELVYDIDKDGIDLIKKFESFSPVSYFDHKAYTIGYGTQKLCNGKKVTKNTKKMTELEAEKHLKCLLDVKNDLLIAYYIDNKMEITQEMHNALISFVFNLGSYQALRSSVFKHLHNKQCYLAVKSLKTFNKASGQVLKGLEIRRNEEAEMLLNGCKEVNKSLGYEFYNVNVNESKKKKVKHK